MAAISTVDSLLDRLAIQDCLATYCRGIDRLDVVLIASAYWPDALEDHGIFKGTGREFAPWIIRFLDESYVSTAHRLGQSNVTLQDGGAAGETYFSSLHKLRAGEGTRYEAVDGRYADAFEKRGEEWRISSRTVILDFVREFSAPKTDIESLPGLTFGSRGHQDFSYSLLRRA
jgi:hypothetical protein